MLWRSLKHSPEKNNIHCFTVAIQKPILYVKSKGKKYLGINNAALNLCKCQREY